MSGKIRGRFTLQKIEQFPAHSDDACLCNVEFSAVTSGKADCETWSKYTPNGKLEMTITNPAAMKCLAVGKDYYVDLEPVE
ncbi:MAG: hypothetical protein VR71_02245 [Roseovarius sp. BRH_c41]|uniref:hypothetical protein n=1 Tax=Roseovarius sp. BRH_c41 TaxID=1629709 RepID=UPI0005F0C89E|nr:hypothetical protein [Roseovarius sp. BRH_c41]KJS45250.1 MAG: hypothetical protein VR71_02245 [Roseovarius sp. BRH_c41]